MQSKAAVHLAHPRIVYQCSECQCPFARWKRIKTTRSVVSSIASNTLNTFYSVSTIDSKMSACVKEKEKLLWPQININAFLNILFEFLRKKKITGKSVKEPVWLEMLTELNKHTNKRYTYSQMREKYKRMKKEWLEFHQLLLSTHGRWDPENFTLVVAQEKRDEMKGNKAFQRFQKHGLRRYDEMTVLWADGTATGTYARSSNNAEPSLEEERGMQNTQDTQDTHVESEGLGDSTTAVPPSGGSRPSRLFNGKRRFDTYSPHPTTTSSSSKSLKMDDLRRKVMTTFLDEDSVTGGGGGSKWTPKQCLDDVRLLDGITPLEVMNASQKFSDPVQREIYMEYTTLEKLLWVDNYCRKQKDM